jgi:hypothetical protein
MSDSPFGFGHCQRSMASRHGSHYPVFMPTERIVLRYVVLRHEGVDRPHFDLLFETAPGSALAAWRAQHWPVEDGEAVEPLADHRRVYLDYQGPVSGDRGVVRRVHEGRHELLEDAPAAMTTRLETGSTLALPRQPGPARLPGTGSGPMAGNPPSKPYTSRP